MTSMTNWEFKNCENWFKGAGLIREESGVRGFRDWRQEVMAVASEVK